MGANGKSVCHGHGDDAWLSKCPCPSATVTELTRGAAYALAAGSRCGCLSEMTFRCVSPTCGYTCAHWLGVCFGRCSCIFWSCEKLSGVILTLRSGSPAAATRLEVVAVSLDRCGLFVELKWDQSLTCLADSCISSLLTASASQISLTVPLSYLRLSQHPRSLACDKLPICLEE